MTRNRIGIACALALAGLAFPQAPLAATMTFSSVDPGHTGVPWPYVEDGITVTPPGGPTFGDTLQWGGRAHLDDRGTAAASTLSFTMAARFDLVSLDVFGFSTDYHESGDLDPVPYENVLFTGYRGGVEVATEKFSTGIFRQTFHLTNADLGGRFVNLDEFRVAAVLPSTIPPNFFCGAPCGHFSVDNLVLNPTVQAIPVPAALPMLLIGIATLLAAATGLRARA